MELCDRCEEEPAEFDLTDPWGRVHARWCARCYDNYEPPKTDGEAFSGNEAAEYEREQQAAIRRELK